MYPVTVRTSLVEALSTISRLGKQESARDFLEGLSTDELQYIAAYFGARTLDPELNDSTSTRGGCTRAIERYEKGRVAKRAWDRSSGNTRTATKQATDVSHKMIVLLEFLTVNERTIAHAKAWSAVGGCA